MKRKLRFKDTLIIGDYMQEIVDIFPNLKDCFRQRKNFYEYYFDETEVELTLDIIQKLNDLSYSVKIFSDEVILDY
jgi:hypothetical protein